MPLYPNSRYNPLYGYPPQVSPGLLSPDVGDSSSPAFDPTMAALAQNQQAPPLPPPPQTQPAPQRLNDTAAGASIQNLPPLTPPNGQFPAGGSARDTGVKQLLAKSMPPPGMAPASTPDVAASPDSIEAAPEPTAADVTAGVPASATGPTDTDKQISELAQQAKDLKKPELGKTNWLQRLSSALLAMTRFAPYSDQIVHPKFTEQLKAYEGQQADIAGKAKTLENAEATEAQAESRRGWAAQRKSTELLNQERAEQLANKPASDAAARQLKLDEDAQKFYQTHTQDIEKAGGQIVPQGMQIPPDWTQIPIENPSTKQHELWVQPPLLTSIKNEDPALAGELIKRNMMTDEQAGQAISPAARKSYRDMLQKAREDEANNASKAPANVPIEDQLINEYINDPHNLKPDGSKPSKLDAKTAITAKTQPPQRPPQALAYAPDPNVPGGFIAQEVGPGTHLGPGALTQAGVNSENSPTAQMRNVAAQAGLVHQQTPAMLSELDRLKGSIGPLAGRWNEFMQGKVGMDNPDFAGLRADLLMYSSAVALMHARGRLPENLREEFDRMLNNPGQNFENLKSAMSHIDDWTAKNMAAMGSNPAATVPAQPAPKIRKYNTTTGKLE